MCIIMEIVEKYVPWKEKRKNERPKWFNKEVEAVCKHKRKAWNRWKKSMKEANKETYRKLEKETKGMIRKRKKGLEKIIAKESKSNPKSFYAYINSGKNMRSKIGPLKGVENGETTIVADPKKQAEILNTYYASVFTRSADDVPELERGLETPIFDDISMNEERVKATIERLKEQSAPGPDGVPNKLLKETVNQVALPLSILFHQSLLEETIPEKWRVSSITPIFKKGKKSKPGNYRPISPTSAVCKLMERIIKEDVEKHLEMNGLIGNSQHGFRHGRSPQTNLVEYMDQTT